VRGRSALAASLAVAGALAVGGAALAGEQENPNIGDEVAGKAGGLRYSADSQAFNPANVGYATNDAGCGHPSWHLVGGGSAASGPSDDVQLASGRGIDFTDPDDRVDDGFLASGYGATGGAITSFSICRPGGGVKYVRVEVPDGSSGLRTGQAHCGGRRWHVSAGSTFIATSESWTNSSHPFDGGDRDRTPDDGWRGRVFDTANGPGGFYIYAICLRGTALRYGKAQPVTIADEEARTRVARCRRKEHVVGGGAKLTGPISRGRLIATHPSDSGDVGSVPDDRWRAGAFNVSGLEKRLTTYAICLR